MTPVQAANDRGHLMRPSLSVNGRDRWVCLTCLAVLQIDAKNPNGWGSAMERACLGDAA